MNAETLKAWADLAWPVLAAIIAFTLLPTIIRISKSRAFKIKYGDMEISVQDATDQMQRQIIDLQKQVLALQEKGRAVQEADRAFAEAAVSTQTPPGHRDQMKLLWVDDNPQNNAHEIATLQNEGWDVSTVESTAAALTSASGASRPAVIISDMGRREGMTFRTTAGLDLIKELRVRHIDVPVIVYASASAAREYHDQVIDVGGDGITASPVDLFKMVERFASSKALNRTTKR